MFEVRSFLNADLRDLHHVYVDHHAKFGPPPRISLAQFEQAIVARTFFQPENLLVGTLDQRVVGWCQFFEQLSSAETEGHGYVIANLCTISGDLPVSTASETISDRLLQAVIQRTNRPGSTLTAGIVRDQYWGYAGLEPVGAAYGISTNDLKLTNLLQQNGFTIASQHIRLQAATQAYRMPMNREAMQWRRTCTLQKSSKKPSNMRQAAAFSHLDVITFSLVARDGQTHASMDAWLSDPEAEVMSPTLAILNQPNPEAQVTIDSAHAYLIGQVVTEMPQLGVQHVEMVLDQSSVQAIEMFGKLGFQQTGQGIRFVRENGDLNP